MRIYIGLFFSALLFLAACSGDSPPSGILERQRMINLLVEVHLADGSLYNQQQLPDSLYKYGAARYLSIFKKLHTDSIQFRKSFKYYTTRPEQLQAMYDEVSQSLKKKNDSINKIKDVLPAKQRR